MANSCRGWLTDLKLEQNIANVEDGEQPLIPAIDSESKVLGHARNPGVSYVGSVQEGK